jgi:hypothetical protein
MSNQNIKFIQIKPNSNNDINNIFNETTLKLATNDELNMWNPIVEDIIDDINDYICQINNDDPISYINNYFKSQQAPDELVLNDQSNSNYYEIFSYDTNLTNQQYLIMLIDRSLNSSTHIKNLSESEKKSKFNLTASTLIKYYSNSKAIFGDVFIIGITKDYLDLLNNIIELKEKNLNITEEELKLDLFKKIYWDFNYIDLFNSSVSVNYVKIFISQSNAHIYYQRNILDNFIKNSKYEIIKSSNIITCVHDDLQLYMKFTDQLPNSHYNIINMVNYQTNKDDINLYLVNITKTDIELIKSQ